MVIPRTVDEAVEINVNALSFLSFEMTKHENVLGNIQFSSIHGSTITGYRFE